MRRRCVGAGDVDELLSRLVLQLRDTSTQIPHNDLDHMAKHAVATLLHQVALVVSSQSHHSWD